MPYSQTSYQLYPGLKQILEDKRIKRWGVPAHLYHKYLSAEQFVIDVRNVHVKELADMNETFFEMDEMGLGNPPCDCYVLHMLRVLSVPPEFLAKSPAYIALDNTTLIDSIFWHKMNGHLYYNILCDSESEAERLQLYQNDAAHKEAREDDRAITIAHKNRFIVMLNTKGAIKQYASARKSQAVVNGVPHKKGSGGYTIIRPPTAEELARQYGENYTGSMKLPHFRRGHIRKLHPEDRARWVWVSPCFVNGDPEIQRTAYLVKTPVKHQEV